MKNNQKNANYVIFSKSVNREIDRVISEKFNKKDLKKINSPIIPYLSWIYSGGVALFVIGFLLLGFGLILSDASNWIFVALLGLFSLPGMICLVIFYSHKKSINKILIYFKNPQNIRNFYSHYSRLFYPKIIVNDLDFNYSKETVTTFNPKILAKHIVTNINLHGTFEDYNFSVGTRTYMYAQPGNKLIEYINEEHLYLLANIDQTNFKTIITPETKLTRFFKGKKNRNNALESQEFEQIFKLDYSDPIKLRKLLAPRVMANLIDLAKNNIVPEIALDGDKLMIHQIVDIYKNVNSMGVTSSTIKKSYFAHLKDQKFAKIDDIKYIIKQTIVQDFEKMHQVLKWVSAFKLHLNYDIKTSKAQKSLSKEQQNGKKSN